MEKNNQTLNVAAVLSLLLGFLMFIFVILPKIQNIKQVSADIATKQSELKAGQEKVAALRQAVQLMTSAKKDLEILGVAIPASENAEEAFAQLAANSSASGLEIKSTGVSTGEADSGGNLTLTITLSGKFENFKTFLENLEKNLRPVKITDYNMAYNAETTNIDTTFNLSFPYIAQEKAVTEEGNTETEEGGLGVQ